eukprot:349785-Chlamydomonas_euryale.AAC.19
MHACTMCHARVQDQCSAPAAAAASRPSSKDMVALKNVHAHVGTATGHSSMLVQCRRLCFVL